MLYVTICYISQLIKIKFQRTVTLDDAILNLNIRNLVTKEYIKAVQLLYHSFIHISSQRHLVSNRLLMELICLLDTIVL